MADALCGPSNALQNFQKHTAVDRTLQQDRLVTRQPSAQGFRSQPSNAGFLDAEFEAFETNFTGHPVPELDQVGPYAFSSHGQQHLIFPTAGSGDWAADFQKLQLSGHAHGGPQRHFSPSPLLNHTAPGGWQDDFARHQQQQNQHSSFQQSSRMPTFQSSLKSSFQMNRDAMQPMGAHQGVPQAQNQLVPETFDESAFEAAFVQARAEIEIQENASVMQQEVVTEAEPQQTNMNIVSDDTEHIQIGSDLIQSDMKPETQERREDPDELARTAGQLLDSVRHDRSQKFRESSFLALMRRIRDREVHIEGDEFREVSTLP